MKKIINAIPDIVTEMPDGGGSGREPAQAGCVGKGMLGAKRSSSDPPRESPPR